MMVTPIYMLFQFRYSSHGYEDETDSLGYLFYNPLENKLYELPRHMSRTDDRAHWRYPLRFLGESTPVKLPVRIKDPYDFAHGKAKIMRELLKERHPGCIKLLGWGKVMRVVHDNTYLFYHGSRWMDKAESKSKRDVGVFDTDIFEMTDTEWNPKRNLRHHRLSTKRFNNGKMLIIPDFRTITPTSLSRWEWSFYEVSPLELRPTPLFLIRETLIRIGKTRGIGWIERWAWNPWSEQNVSHLSVPVDMSLVQGGEWGCYIEGEQQRSSRQIWETANRILKSCRN